MKYPDSISPYIYRGGFDKSCEHELNDKGVGAFAFYEVDQPWGIEQRNQERRFQALSRTMGNPYAADKYIGRAEEIGFAMVLNGGIIKHLKMDCRRIRNSRRKKDELFADFVKKGLPIDLKKFCDPAAMYRPAVWE